MIVLTTPEMARLKVKGDGNVVIPKKESHDL